MTRTACCRRLTKKSQLIFDLGSIKLAGTARLLGKLPASVSIGISPPTPSSARRGGGDADRRQTGRPTRRAAECVPSFCLRQKDGGTEGRTGDAIPGPNKEMRGRRRRVENFPRDPDRSMFAFLALPFLLHTKRGGRKTPFQFQYNSPHSEVKTRGENPSNKKYELFGGSKNA